MWFLSTPATGNFSKRRESTQKIVIIKTEAALAALAAGDLDYSTLSTSSIEATLKGLPLRVIAVTNKHPSSAWL